MAKLPDKREQFCQQFLTDANGTQAAIRAGYAERSAHVAACRLLKNDKVQHRIAELFQRRAEKLEIDRDRIVRGLLIEAVGRGPDTSSSARTRAWLEIARLLGMLTERVQVNATVIAVDATEDDENRERFDRALGIA